MLGTMLGTLVQTTTSDGVRLHGFLVAPAKTRDAWVLVHGVNSNFYSSSLLIDIAHRLSSQAFGVLLVNTRGHDILSFNSGPAPVRTGSQIENIAASQLDLDAWFQFLNSQGFDRIHLLGHSLGAIKAVLWSLKGNRHLKSLVAVSPPRLNTNLLMEDPNRGRVFSEHLRDAKKWCEDDQPDYVMKVRFPLPMWISASAYLDKYGSGEKYDYLAMVPEIKVPTLWTFGQYEVESGSSNFYQANSVLNQYLLDRQEALGIHSVRVVPDADHSYRGVTAQLGEVLNGWWSRRAT